MSLLEKIAGLVPAEEHVYISITGGGGKSSLMRDLAALYRKKGKKVLITTSTHIQSPVFYDWGADEQFFSYEEIEKAEFSSPCCVLFGYKMQDDIKRLKSPSEFELKTLKKRFDVLICEADGSRSMPLKFHTSRDPVIYPFSTYTVAVLGAWAYGKEAWEVTFGYEGDNIVDSSFLNSYIASADGLLKGQPDLVLVNGLDGGLKGEPFEALSWPEGLKVLGGSLQENKLVFEL